MRRYASLQLAFLFTMALLLLSPGGIPAARAQNTPTDPEFRRMLDRLTGADYTERAKAKDELFILIDKNKLTAAQIGTVRKEATSGRSLEVTMRLEQLISRWATTPTGLQTLKPVRDVVEATKFETTRYDAGMRDWEFNLDGFHGGANTGTRQVVELEML
jgi:hypothetical protein